MCTLFLSLYFKMFFQLFETMCYQFFAKIALFTPDNTLLGRILATSLDNNEEDSLDGNSFVSQYKFDA